MGHTLTFANSADTSSFFKGKIQRLPAQLQRELPKLWLLGEEKNKSSVNIWRICNYRRNIERFHVAGMGIQHTTGLGSPHTRWKSSATGTQDET
jgi:hypothetical protein